MAVAVTVDVPGGTEQQMPADHRQDPPRRQAARGLAGAPGRPDRATGKNLITVYITHGHGDHFFGRSGVATNAASSVPCLIAPDAAWRRQSCCAANQDPARLRC
jgi:ribonuclease BN (tRNA processing enzyme)